MVIIDKINFIDGVTELSADNFNQIQENTEIAIEDLRVEKDIDLTALETLLKTYGEDFVKSQRRGTLFYWPGDTPPTGALIRNGQAVSRTTYAALFAILGTKYGVGDGSTTFNLPDDVTDNRFIRAAGGSLTVGTTQQDEFESHSHGLPETKSTTSSEANPGAYFGEMKFTNDATGHTSTSSTGVSSVGGTETRPKNIAYLPCIWH